MFEERKSEVRFSKSAEMSDERGSPKGSTEEFSFSASIETFCKYSKE